MRSKVDFFLELDRSKRELELKLEAARKSEQNFRSAMDGDAESD